QSLIDPSGVKFPIQRGRQDESVLVNLTPLRIERERSSVPQQRTTEVETINLSPVRRPRGLCEQRIARVQAVVVVLREGLAAQQVAAGFGEDLDASETRAVIFGRERVGVDPDFP